MDTFGTPLYVEAAFAAFGRALQDAARTDLCYRCDQDPAGRIDPLEPEPGLCRPCLDEISHAIEMRHMEGGWHQLGDDDTDGGRYVA